MKIKLLILLLVIVGCFNWPGTVHAEIDPTRQVEIQQSKEELKQEREKFKQEMKQQKEALREEINQKMKEQKQTIIDKVKEQVKDKLKLIRSIINGTYQTFSGNTLTVTDKEGNTHVVTVTSDTKIVRRFGGKSELSEFSTGDELNIIGRYTDQSKATFEAQIIRNRSIQKRFGAFIGTVTQVNGDNIVIDTVNRGTLTVYFSSNTKFTNRKEESMTVSEVKVDHKIRVKGIYDKTLSKLTEVEQIKDFSLPVVPKVSTTPKATVSPTASPTMTPTSTPTPSPSI